MKKPILILLCSLFSIACFTQNNYYVATTGNDADDGSLATPWQSIQYAVTQLSAGDVLEIMAGTYVGKIDLSVSGAIGQTITIKNHNSDHVIIEGSTLSDYEYLLKIEDVDFITITGLKFQDYQKLDAIGILVINSSNVTISNNEFSNIDYSATAIGQTPNSSQNSQPIIVFGRDPLHPISNLIIDGNTIFDCEVGYSECLSVNGNVDGFEVTNNHIYNNTNIPIVAIGHEGECSDPQFDQARNGLIKNNNVHDNPSAYAAAGGIYIDGAKSVVVENNISYNNNYGIEVGCENNGAAPNDPSASNITVRNNLLYNNTITGIAFGGYNYPTTGKVETTTIRNNTCFNNDTDNSYSGEMYITYVENSSIENNIFYTNNADKVLFIASEAIPTLALNYNLFYTPSGTNDIAIEINGTGYYEFSTYQSGASQDANSSFGNPMFVSENIPGPDLHIAAASPAVDSGNPSFVAGAGETDMDGEARLQNMQVDRGADESDVMVPVSYVMPFQAYAKATAVELSWTTVTELNTDKFIVQRSVDLRQWESLFSVKGQGTTTQTSFYRGLDTAPLSGLSYYRLQQIDFDGSYAYSNMAAVQRDASWAKIAAFPNPAQETINFEFDLPRSAGFLLQIFDANGKLMQEQKEGEAPILELDVSDWRTGIYFVRLLLENGDFKELRFIVAR